MNRLVLQGIEDKILNNAGNMLDKAIGAQSLSSMQELLQFTNNATVWADFWSFINNALEIIKPFGYALITTYFLMYLFDAAAKDNVTVDSLIKVLIQLVLVIALVKNLDLIINTFLSLSDTLIAKLSGKSIEGSSISLTGREIVDKWDAESNDTSITIWVQSLLIAGLGKIAQIGVMFAAITRAIEVGWRIVLSPIGVANCFEGGANSKGIQYLKTLFCCILSGVTIYITAAVGFALAGNFLSVADDEGSLFVAIAVMLGTTGAAIGASNKVRDLA